MLPRLLSPHIRRAFRTPTTTTRFAFSRHTQSKEARPKAGKQERSSVPPLAFVFDIVSYSEDVFDIFITDEMISY